MCSHSRCKYIEVSAGLNHRVDDLLVGIVSQVRLNDERREILMQASASGDTSTSSADEDEYKTTLTSRTNSYLGMLKRLFGFKTKEVQSACENLQTL